MITKICLVCKKSFEVHKYRINQAKFCCRKCKSISQIGNVKPNSGQFKKGQQNWLGKHHSEETKQKLSKILMGRVAWNKNKPFPQICGENNGWWSGGKTHNEKGYIMIRKPDHPFCSSRGYVREHRLIIEQQIGRYLLPEEVGHHINEIVVDNRPENLMAFATNSAHNRFHKDPLNVFPYEIIFDGSALLKSSPM